MFFPGILCPLSYFFEVCSQKYSYWVRGSGAAARFLETQIWLLQRLAQSGGGGGGCLPCPPPQLASFPELAGALLTLPSRARSESLTHKVMVSQTVVIRDLRPTWRPCWRSPRCLFMCLFKSTPRTPRLTHLNGKRKLGGLGTYRRKERSQQAGHPVPHHLPVTRQLRQM